MFFNYDDNMLMNTNHYTYAFFWSQYDKNTDPVIAW